MAQEVNKIRAVIFDVGGVLSSGKSSYWEKNKFIPSGVHVDIAKKLNISIDQYLDAIDTNYALSLEGKISKEKVLSIFSKNFRVSKEKVIKLYLWAYRKHFKENKVLFNEAIKLKKLGYKVGILSDQWYLSKEALMKGKRYKIFDPTIVSCDVKLRKPNPRIYQLLLNKLNLKPSEVIFIDNQLWNIKSAKKLGIQTILYKNNSQLFQEKLWRSLFKK